MLTQKMVKPSAQIVSLNATADDGSGEVCWRSILNGETIWDFFWGQRFFPEDCAFVGESPAILLDLFRLCDWVGTTSGFFPCLSRIIYVEIVLRKEQLRYVYN